MSGGDWAGKVAIVTGAAGGIGSAIARRLDREGIRLALADVDEKGMERLASELTNKPLALRCDIDDRAAVQSAIEQTVAEFGGLDILVNNAGVIRPGMFEEASYEDIDFQVNINLLGAINMTKAAIPEIRRQGGGRIVMISSLAGIIPETGSAIYTATKFALRGLGQTLHLELKPHNIGVSTIFPDSVATPMLEYEAAHGGSSLAFLSDPIRPETIAEVAWKAMKKNKIEAYVPHSQGLLTKFASFAPGIIPLVWPLLEKAGEKKRQKNRSMGK